MVEKVVGKHTENRQSAENLLNAPPGPQSDSDSAYAICGAATLSILRG